MHDTESSVCACVSDTEHAECACVCMTHVCMTLSMLSVRVCV